MFNLSSLPTQPSTLILYVSYKTLVLNHAIGTTLNALSAIRREHLSAGLQLPTPTGYFPLQEAIRGARRYLSRPTVQKLPMSPGLLAQLLGATGWGSCWRCLLLTLWLTLARLASLIPTGGEQVFQPDAHLTWSNVHFRQEAVLIVLEKTKTIQCGERNLQFLIPRHPNRSVCLYTLRPSSYGWSSFRRGGATASFLATGDIESLRANGDWASSAYVRYLAIPATDRTSLIASLQDSLV